MVSRGDVRRAWLPIYLRELRGKAAKIREARQHLRVTETPPPAALVPRYGSSSKIVIILVVVALGLSFLVRSSCRRSTCRASRWKTR